MTRVDGAVSPQVKEGTQRRKAHGAWILSSAAHGVAVCENIRGTNKLERDDKYENLGQTGTKNTGRSASVAVQHSGLAS